MEKDFKNLIYLVLIGATVITAAIQVQKYWRAIS